MCGAEQWRLLECHTLEQLWVLIERGKPWIVVVPEQWDDIRIDQIGERLLAHPMRKYIAVVGFLLLGHAEAEAAAIRAGVDVCVSYGLGIDGLRRELRRLVPLAAEMRGLRAWRSARRPSPYAGPRRRDSDRRHNHQASGGGTSEEQPTMIWLFERAEEAIRIETRFDRQTGEYVLITADRVGVRHTERFGDASAFRLRLEALEQQLATDRWTRTGPFLLRDGWRL